MVASPSKPPGWRAPNKVKERHDIIIDLSRQGYSRGQIAYALKVDRSSLVHHLRDYCSCYRKHHPDETSTDWLGMMQGN